MRKLLIALCLGALAAIMPATATAQQTREEATDSVKNILSMAKKGDAVAQNVVGGWYYRGRHVKQDYEEAIKKHPDLFSYQSVHYIVKATSRWSSRWRRCAPRATCSATC